MQRIQNYTHNHVRPFDEHTMLIREGGGTLLTIHIIHSLKQREHNQMVTQSFQILQSPVISLTGDWERDAFLININASYHGVTSVLLIYCVLV